MLCLAEVVCFCCVWGRGDPLQRINEDKLIYQGYYSHRLVIRNYGLKKDLYNSVFYEKKNHYISSALLVMGRKTTALVQDIPALLI